MTLKQHFGNPGSRAEVAIYLEWRMSIEEVGQRGFLKEGDQVFVSFFAIVQARPKVDYPGAAPACMAATVSQPVFQRFARGGKQLG
jgi:hypothetical protein